MVLNELAFYEFQKGEMTRGFVYKKASQSINECTYRIKPGWHCCNLPSIRLGTAKIIMEFLATGKIEELEKYRRVGTDEC